MSTWAFAYAQGTWLPVPLKVVLDLSHTIKLVQMWMRHCKHSRVNNLWLLTSDLYAYISRGCRNFGLLLLLFYFSDNDLYIDHWFEAEGVPRDHFCQWINLFQGVLVALVAAMPYWTILTTQDYLKDLEVVLTGLNHVDACEFASGYACLRFWSVCHGNLVNHVWQEIRVEDSVGA